jgi:hypothetical protein
VYARAGSVVVAEPPHPTLGELVLGVLELVDEEPIAELGIIGVHVDDRVGDVRVAPVALHTGRARHW